MRLDLDARFLGIRYTLGFRIFSTTQGLGMVHEIITKLAQMYEIVVNLQLNFQTTTGHDTR